MLYTLIYTRLPENVLVSYILPESYHLTLHAGICYTPSMEKDVAPKAEIISDSEAQRIVKITTRRRANQVKSAAGMRKHHEHAQKAFERVLTDNLNR